MDQETEPKQPTRRRGKIPDAPQWPRPVTGVLEDGGDILSLLLWQIARDVQLWVASPPEEHGGLFDPVAASVLERWAHEPACSTAPREQLHLLIRMVAHPTHTGEADVARACAVIRDWASQAGRLETALHFAEAAAAIRMQDGESAREAARLSRDIGEHGRAVLWFRRAAALASRSGDVTLLGRVRLGWGSLAHSRGKMIEAERMCTRALRAATRNGNCSLMAQARHELFAIAVTNRDKASAVENASQAAELYPLRDARLAAFAFDVGFYWMLSGYHSLAVSIFQLITDEFPDARDRTLYLAAYARAAAAVRDRLRYERMREEVLEVARRGSEERAVALYHLAEGARAFERWEQARELGEMALGLAKARRNPPLIDRITILLSAVASHVRGEDDELPAAGTIQDRLTTAVIAKLARRMRR